MLSPNSENVVGIWIDPSAIAVKPNWFSVKLAVPVKSPSKTLTFKLALNDVIGQLRVVDPVKVATSMLPNVEESIAPISPVTLV